jgi:hypothetical protein
MTQSNCGAGFPSVPTIWKPNAWQLNLIEAGMSKTARSGAMQRTSIVI